MLHRSPLKSVVLFAGAMLAALFACGCAAALPTPVLVAATAPVENIPRLEQGQMFQSYRVLFTAIARSLQIPEDQDSLMELAMDSTIDHQFSAKTGSFIVIRPDFFAKYKYGIRGAQGQGNCYAFKKQGDAWRLIGAFPGGSYELDIRPPMPRIRAYWHVSVNDSGESDVTWNGVEFEPFTTDP